MSAQSKRVILEREILQRSVADNWNDARLEWTLLHVQHVKRDDDHACA